MSLFGLYAILYRYFAPNMNLCKWVPDSELRFRKGEGPILSVNSVQSRELEKSHTEMD